MKFGRRITLALTLIFTNVSLKANDTYIFEDIPEDKQKEVYCFLATDCTKVSDNQL